MNLFSKNTKALNNILLQDWPYWRFDFNQQRRPSLQRSSNSLAHEKRPRLRPFFLFHIMTMCLDHDYEIGGV